MRLAAPKLPGPSIGSPRCGSQLPRGPPSVANALVPLLTLLPRSHASAPRRQEVVIARETGPDGERLLKLMRRLAELQRLVARLAVNPNDDLHKSSRR